jgi:HK97 family phage major capsid protein
LDLGRGEWRTEFDTKYEEFFMDVREMSRARKDLSAKIESILMKAGEENRALTDRDQKDLVGLRADANDLDKKIKSFEDSPDHSLAKMFREGGPSMFLDGGQRPTNPKGLFNGVELKPDMGRFQAEFHDWVNAKLGNPWQPKLSASDEPIYIGSGAGVESVGFTIPTEVLPYLPAYYNLNSFALAGAREIVTPDTIPLVLPVLSAGPATGTFAEGAMPTNSQPFAADSFTFHGTKYSRLVKVSYEALMNSALPLQGAIQDEMLASIATTFTAAITTALLTALTGNDMVLVAQGGSDVYRVLTDLLHAIPPRFDLPTNKFMLSRASLATIKDQRASTSGVPMFDPVASKIFDRDVVINDNLSGGQVVYGDWQDGCIIRKTPLITRVFYEAYAEQGEVGFRVAQWLDQHFLCELGDVTNQPLAYTVLGEVEGS